MRLEAKAEGIAVHVIDEGRGFDLEVGAARKATAGGFGLANMRERLRLVGGRVEVRSRPGRGTHVEVHAPLNPNYDEASDPLAS